MKRFALFISILGLSLSASAQTPNAQSGTGTCADDGDVDTLETICYIPLGGYSSVVVQGTVATAAFSDFNIDIAVVPDTNRVRMVDCQNATYVTYYTASEHYTSPSGYLHSASADLTSWSTTVLSFKLDGLEGVGCIRLQAAGTNSNPAITWRLQ